MPAEAGGRAGRLANGAREGNRVNPPRAAPAQGARGGGDRRAARVDVVNEADVRRDRPSGGERATDVGPPLDEREASLAIDLADATQEALDRELPACGKLAGELLGGPVAALERPLAVGGHERDRIDRRPREHLGDELGREPGEAAATALLPLADESLRRLVVDDRGPSRGEREPPSGALRAARYGPGARRAAARAERRREPVQGATAALAERLAAAAADGTALG